VFVIEEAEGLRDESQNALLKTLEEPAPFAHMILICSEPELLAGTILSRCRPVEFSPLAPDAVLQTLDRDDPEARAAARLCGGDARLAELLLGETGAALR
jgi:DNA polymerase-3 subunit delta'